MKKILFSVLAVLALGWTGALAAPVHTTSGVVEGTVEGGLAVYRGIPFAAPPVENLRWKPPQPVLPWKGVRASLDQPIRYSLDFSLLFLQGTWQIKPKSPWSIGLRYIYSQVEPKLRDEPLFAGLADHIDVDISAPAAVLEFDSRDNVFTPTRGWFATTCWPGIWPTPTPPATRPAT